MRAGELRHRVVLQRRSTARDSYGGLSDAWTDVATVWAQIRPMSEREFATAREAIAGSEATHIVMIRHYPDVTPDDWRVKYGSRVFDIEGARNIEERNQMLLLRCVERR